jgi:hypothetical protein
MTVADEIDRAGRLAREMAGEYAAWYDRIKYGGQPHPISGQILDRDGEAPTPTCRTFVYRITTFQFRQFNPEFYRLDDSENYFRFREPTEEEEKADEAQREIQQQRYKFYLSYEGLLYSLKINGLADDAIRARIDAHYTFLGMFLHPTHDAARKLHDHPNGYDGRTRVGLNQTYTELAVLLGYVYVCYLLGATLDEAASFIEQAPTKYVTDPGTANLRALTSRVPAEFPYFWFLTNDPPLWDRYNYCSNHTTTQEREAWGGGYERVPFDRVLFDQHVYPHLQSSYGFWESYKDRAAPL